MKIELENMPPVTGRQYFFSSDSREPIIAKPPGVTVTSKFKVVHGTSSKYLNSCHFLANSF